MVLEAPSVGPASKLRILPLSALLCAQTVQVLVNPFNVTIAPLLVIPRESSTPSWYLAGFE